MPVTRTEQTTRNKEAENRANATYQKELQQAKIDRDKELAAVHSDRDRAQHELTSTHREAVRKIWARFHDRDRTLRDKRRKQLQ